MSIARGMTPNALALPSLRKTAPQSCSKPSIQARTFLDSFLSSALGPCPLRKLSHTRAIPYSQAAIFKAVSDVSGYPAFLPFTISSHVTSRDESGYPVRASLRIGYDKLGLEEKWDSLVHCDAQKGIVEAKSGDQASGGLFEVLSTRWQIGTPNQHADKPTEVKLEVQVKFRNSIYDQMFSQVEDKVAATMITAFENRVREIEQSNTTKNIIDIVEK